MFEIDHTQEHEDNGDVAHGSSYTSSKNLEVFVPRNRLKYLLNSVYRHLELGFIDFEEVHPSSTIGSWRSALQRLSDNFELETVRLENLKDGCLVKPGQG